MAGWIVNFTNWLGSLLPAGLDAPTATLRGAQLTATVALVAAAVAFITALIAGLVALRNGYLTIRTTAQIKHADFRQTWINALRDEMTTFQSLAVPKIWDDQTDAALVKSSTKVLLLMNPKDRDYQQLLNALHAVLSGWHVERDKWLDAHADLIMLCQQILKREWNVTKREMHATAHIFFVRWAIGFWRIVVWTADRIIYRPILRPFGRQLYRGDIKPFWDKHGPGVTNLIRSRTPIWIMVRYKYWREVWRDKKEHDRAVMRPDPIDLDEIPGRKEAPAKLIIEPAEVTSPTAAEPEPEADLEPAPDPESEPFSPPLLRARLRAFGARIWAAILYVYDGRALP